MVSLFCKYMLFAKCADNCYVILVSSTYLKVVIKKASEKFCEHCVKTLQNRILIKRCRVGEEFAVRSHSICNGTLTEVKRKNDEGWTKEGGVSYK